MDIKMLAENLGFDEEDITELLDLFITTALSDIDRIKQGIAENNIPDAAAASHSIKGAAGNLGIDEIYLLAENMEKKAKQGSLENFEKLVKDLETKVNDLSKT